jgi:hypothetical protein
MIYSKMQAYKMEAFSLQQAKKYYGPFKKIEKFGRCLYIATTTDPGDSPSFHVSQLKKNYGTHQFHAT